MIGRADRKGMMIFDDIIEYCEQSLTGKAGTPKELPKGQWLIRINTSADTYLALGKYVDKLVRRYPSIFYVLQGNSLNDDPYIIFKYKGLKEPIDAR